MYSSQSPRKIDVPEGSLVQLTRKWIHMFHVGHWQG